LCFKMKKLVKGRAFDTEDEYIKDMDGDMKNNFRYFQENYKILSRYLNGKLLDAGCGIGILALFYDNSKYVGLDVSKKFIKYARAKHPKAKFIVHNLNEKLPFKNKEFDTSIILWALHHIKNYDLVIKELKRVSKKVVIGEIFYKFTFLGLFFPVINRIGNTYVKFFRDGELGKSIDLPKWKTSLPSYGLFKKMEINIQEYFFKPKLVIIKSR